MRLVAVDIGGTHARFTVAEVAGSRVVDLGEPVTLRTADHASLQAAWQAFAATQRRALPRAAALSVASPITGDMIRLTNNPWTIQPSLIPDQLGAETYTIINDFGAVGHAVAQLPRGDFAHLTGPDIALPTVGVATICGPGTGLGVAQLLRLANGDYHVLATEGGHVDYAPLDAIEDALVQHLRASFTRVSAERVCAGPGIVAIYETLAALDGRAIVPRDDKAIWAGALDGTDPLAVAALDRFCLALGAVAGDLALAQGAGGVVIAGGLGLRLRDVLPRSGFGERFVAKGRFREGMAGLPVKLVTHPQPGLFGAAAAFAQEHAA